MQIYMKAIKDINPSEYNPRAISKEALEGLRVSIRKFGMQQPLIINKRPDGTEVLTGGHQRLQAAADEGWDKVPVIYTYLTEAEEKAFNVVLNNKNIEGFFTPELQVILKEIEDYWGNDYMKELNLDALVYDSEWESDLGKLDVDADDQSTKAKIIIECKTDLKDEVLIYIKSKLMETSFEDIHIR